MEWEESLKIGAAYGIFPEDYESKEEFLDEVRFWTNDDSSLNQIDYSQVPSPVMEIPIRFTIEPSIIEHSGKEYLNARQKQVAGFWDTFRDDSEEFLDLFFGTM